MWRYYTGIWKNIFISLLNYMKLVLSVQSYQMYGLTLRLRMHTKIFCIKFKIAIKLFNSSCRFSCEIQRWETITSPRKVSFIQPYLWEDCSSFPCWFVHSRLHLGNTHLLITVPGTIPVCKDSEMNLGSSLPLCLLLTQVSFILCWSASK